MNRENTLPVDSPFNPWLEMWYRPRTTLRRIVHVDPKRSVYLIAALTGITRYLDQASSLALGDNLGLVGILGMGLVAGPLGGIVGLGLSAFAIGFVARRLGSEADNDDVTAAVAWSQLPTIFMLLLWGIQILLFGSAVFKSDNAMIDANPAMGLLFIPIVAASVLLSIWQFVLLVAGVAEVNRFSIARALAAILIPVAIIFALAFACLTLPTLAG